MADGMIAYYESLDKDLKGLIETYENLAKNEKGEIEYPEIRQSQEINDMGVLKRYPAVTHKEKMAEIAEQLHILKDNMQSVALQTEKHKLEQTIAEKDKYYTRYINYLNEEIKKAEKNELIMRNRFLSGYEFNGVNEKEIDALKFDPEMKAQLKNEFIPIDEFKKSWDDASEKLLELKSLKVSVENAYKADFDDYKEKYEENEEKIRASKADPKKAEAAWKRLQKTIKDYKENTDIDNFTEEDLDKTPEKDCMSNYDMWRIKHDLQSLDTVFIAMKDSLEYGDSFDEVYGANSEFKNFEKSIEEHFTNEYKDIDLEDIYRELETEEMKEAQKLKDELDAQAALIDGPENDDYGKLLRNVKLDKTKLNAAQTELDNIKSNIKASEDVYTQMAANLKLQQENVIKLESWNGEGLVSEKPAEDAILVAQNNIDNKDKEIEAKLKEIQDQEKFINETLANRIQEKAQSLNFEVSEFKREEGNLKNLNNRLAEFEQEDLESENSVEFFGMDLDNWVQQYKDFTPEDTLKSVESMLKDSFEAAYEVGKNIADKRYEIYHLNDVFQAYDRFNKAAREDGIVTQAEYDKSLKEFEEKVNTLASNNQPKDDEAFEEEYNNQRDELNRQISDLEKEIKYNPDAIRVEKPEINWQPLRDDSIEDELIEEGQNLYENIFPEWQKLVLKQEEEIINFDGNIAKLKEDAEKEFAKDLEAAETEKRNDFDAITTKYNQSVAELEKTISEEDNLEYNSYFYAKQSVISKRNELSKKHEQEKKEFDEKQLKEAEEFEAKLARKLEERYLEKIQQIASEEHDLEIYADISRLEYLFGGYTLSSLPKLNSEALKLKNQIKFFDERILDDEDSLTEDEKRNNENYKKNKQQIEEKLQSVKGKIAEAEEARKEELRIAVLKGYQDQESIRREIERQQEELQDELNQIAEEERSNFEEGQRNKEEALLNAQEEEMNEIIPEPVPEKFREFDDEFNRLGEIKENEFAQATSKYSKKYYDALEKKDHATEEAEKLSVDNLKKDQEKERRVFANKNVRCEDDDVQRLVNTGLEKYRSAREMQLEQFTSGVKSETANKVNEIKKQLAQLEEQHEKDKLIRENSNKEGIELTEDSNPVLDRNDVITALVEQNKNDYIALLNSRKDYYRNQYVIPNNIKALKRRLEDDQFKYLKASVARDKALGAEQKKYDNLVQNKIPELKKKYLGIADYVEQYSTLSALSEFLTNDIKDWGKKNENSLDVDAAYRFGENIYDQICEQRDNALAGMEFKNDEERKKAEEIEYYRYERRFFYNTGWSQEQKDNYNLYRTVQRYKSIYNTVFHNNEKQIENIEKKLSSPSNWLQTINAIKDEAIGKGITSYMQSKSSIYIQNEDAKRKNEFDKSKIGKIKKAFGGKYNSLTQEEIEKLSKQGAEKYKAELLSSDLYKTVYDSVKLARDYEIRSHELSSKVGEAGVWVNDLKFEIAKLEQEEKENTENILAVEKSIAQNIAERQKYELYNIGLSDKHTQAKNSLEKAEAELVELEKKQEEISQKQLPTQQNLQEKIAGGNFDPFKEKDHLIKKRILANAAVKRYTEEFDKEKASMEALMNDEVQALKEYEALDPSKEILVSWMNKNQWELADSEENLIERRHEYDSNVSSNQRQIESVEKEINDLLAAEFDENDKDYEKNIKARDKSVEEKAQLRGDLENKKKEFEQEKLSIEIAQKAVDVIKIRQSLAEKRKTLGEKEAYLSQAKIAQAGVNEQIKDLKSAIKELAQTKTNYVNGLIPKVESFQEAHQQTLNEDIDARKKLSSLQTEHENLKKQREELVLNKKDAEAYLNDVKTENANVREKKKQELISAKNTVKQVESALVNQKGKIAELNNQIPDAEAKIKKEEKEMYLKQRTERQILGSKMLKVDKYNKLKAQAGKLEGFQRSCSAFLKKERPDTVPMISKANNALYDLLFATSAKMGALEAMSRTVKKWYAKDSKEYSEMIGAVSKLKNLGPDSKVKDVVKQLEAAQAKAEVYINKRNSDFIQTGSLLRKTRLAIARDIVNISKTMASKFGVLSAKMDNAKEAVSKLEQNKTKLKSVVDKPILTNEGKETGTYKTFCEVYTKPIANELKNTQVYYSKPINNYYKYEWDKREKELKDNKINPKGYSDINLKSVYKKNLDKDLDFESKDCDIVMVKSVYDNGLAHLDKNLIDKDYVNDGYYYTKQKTDYSLSALNIGKAKERYDESHPHIIVEKKEPEKVENKNIDISKLNSNDPIAQQILRAQQNGGKLMNNDPQKSEHPKNVNINSDLKVDAFDNISKGNGNAKEEDLNKKIEDPNKQKQMNK